MGKARAAAPAQRTLGFGGWLRTKDPELLERFSSYAVDQNDAFSIHIAEVKNALSNIYSKALRCGSFLSGATRPP